MTRCQKPFLLLAGLLALQAASADVSAPPYAPPGGPGGPGFAPGGGYLAPGGPGGGGGGYGRPGGAGGAGGQYADDAGQPTPYEFKYDVQDAASGQDFGHQESGDGAGNVQGKYYVLLPDGRRQVVTYHADANGYVADVQYEGEAQYPQGGGGGGGGQRPAGAYGPPGARPGARPAYADAPPAFGPGPGAGPANEYLPPRFRK